MLTIVGWCNRADGQEAEDHGDDRGRGGDLQREVGELLLVSRWQDFYQIRQLNQCYRHLN
jgi:hypothetical protein